MTRPLWKKRMRKLRRACKKAGLKVRDIRLGSYDTIDLRGLPVFDLHQERADREGVTRDVAKLRSFAESYSVVRSCGWRN